MSTTTAGSISIDPSKYTAAGKTSIVAEYTPIYSGTYIKGTRFSTSPTKELGLPKI